MKRKYMSSTAFDKMREDNRQEGWVVYVIQYRNGQKEYAWSDDGEGFFFYASMKDLKENH